MAHSPLYGRSTKRLIDRRSKARVAHLMQQPDHRYTMVRSTTSFHTLAKTVRWTSYKPPRCPCIKRTVSTSRISICRHIHRTSISGTCSTRNSTASFWTKPTRSLKIRVAQGMTSCSLSGPCLIYLDPPPTLILLSCGMDACEHEYESMSRHNRKVPTSFYYRFAKDACALADKYASGRLISVLEGGYSDRALTSGAMAHLSGLVDIPPETTIDETWWSVDNLDKLQTATKKRRGGRPSFPAAGSVEPWLERTLAIFTPLDEVATQATGLTSRTTVPVPRSDRTLRDRTKAKNATPIVPPSVSRTNSVVPTPSRPSTTPRANPYISDDSSSLSSVSSVEDEVLPAKKLPKVILRLGKPPEVISST